MAEVLAAIQAWRDAERELSLATDPVEVERLYERVRRLRQEYERLVVARDAALPPDASATVGDAR